jgi:hypothetical protein
LPPIFAAQTAIQNRQVWLPATPLPKGPANDIFVKTLPNGFSASLPDRSSVHPDTPDAAGSPQGKEDPEMKRCMFVDDSSVIRKVAKRILGGPDMVVIEAATGLDAVEM